MRTVEIPQLTSRGGSLTAYLHNPDSERIQRGRRPAVLVIPGGGYRNIVDREADPVAFEFFTAGFNTFVLSYTVYDEEKREPIGIEPLVQATKALLLIRERAEEWNTRGDQVAVLGFSAGGHLAGSCAFLWDSPELKARLDTQGRKSRPDAAVLCYPVTMMTGKHIHQNSITRLVGDQDPALFDLVNHVDEKAPPCFLWSTVEDELVPVENTLYLADALQKHHIPYELHLYTRGRHGLTLGMMESNESHPHLASWVRLCKEWLGDVFRFPISI